MPQLLLAAVIGLAAGVLSGAFGIGGGIVTTPAIRLLLGAPALVAVGTPLAAIIPTALTGAVTYARQGMVDLRTGAVASAAGMPLAVAGAFLADRVGGSVVLLATALLLIAAAIDTVLQARATERRVGEGPRQGDADASPPKLLAPVVIGAVAGAYSGFFGLGGGFVLVPLFTRWLRFDIKRAIATSLVVVCALAIPGTIAHAVLGNIDWLIAGGLVLGVVPGAVVGARITLGASDRTVRYGFAVLLASVGIWLAISELMAVTG